MGLLSLELLSVIGCSLITFMLCQSPCSQPTSTNGILSPSLASYNHGVSVTVTCNIGYYLSLQINTAVCTDGFWQPNLPSCLPYICTTPTFPHIITTSTGPYYHGDSPTFICDTHYYILTASSLICSEGSWIGTQPLCGEIECSALDVADADEAGSADPLTHGEFLRIACIPGYYLTGDTELLCDTSTGLGILMGVVPTCTQIICTASSVTGGVALNSGPYIVGTSVTYLCDVGYYMTGNAVLTCLDTGYFDSSPPVCNPVICEQPKYPNMAVTSSGPYYYEDTATFKCSKSYYMSTAANLRCDPDGNWEGTAPFCSKIQCIVPVIPYSVFSTTGPYYDGDPFSVKCNYGYSLTGDDILVCDASQNPGSFIGVTPVCEPIICEAEDIDYGFYDTVSGGDGPPYFLNESIYYECIAGYKLSGIKVLTCTEERVWNYPLPTCVVATCTAPGIDNGQILSAGPYYWTDIIKYKCNQGYNMTGSASIACGPSGDVEGKTPQCKRNQCTTSNINNGIITSSPPYYWKSEITFKCGSSYYMSGSDTVICNEYGRYSTPAPTCLPVICEPYKPNNATYYPSGPFYVGDHISYLCTNGYELEGSNTRICSPQSDIHPNGVWLGDEPRCTRSMAMSQFDEQESLAWIAGAVTAALVLALLTSILIWWLCCRRRKSSVKKTVQIKKSHRAIHHKPCKCSGCVSKQHHTVCNCDACVDNSKHGHHDEFKCLACHINYLHKATGRNCQCKTCISGRKNHRTQTRCQCRHCLLSTKHRSKMSCECHDCSASKEHFTKAPEACDCDQCKTHREHDAIIRWNHIKHCASCRISHEHTKQHFCNCATCVTMATHANKHGCNCNECNMANLHKLHSSCMCASCRQHEMIPSRFRYSYAQECMCASCLKARPNFIMHSRETSHHQECGNHDNTVNCTSAPPGACVNGSCSIKQREVHSRAVSIVNDKSHNSPAHHAHTGQVILETKQEKCQCDLCQPTQAQQETTPKPTLPHCECPDCVTAREINHKQFCSCLLCTTAHQHTHKFNCGCKKCQFLLNYGGHVTCVTCQDEKTPQLSEKCPDKSCKRCNLKPLPPIKSNEPKVPNKTVRVPAEKPLESTRASAPKVDCWQPNIADLAKTVVRENRLKRFKAKKTLPLNQRPKWMPHSHDNRYDASHANSYTH